jgi:hypothetical protein
MTLNHGKPDILEKIRPDEPAFTFRAQDVHMVDVLRFYERLCQDPEQRAGVYSAACEVIDWQDAHPDLVKEPTA